MRWSTCSTQTTPEKCWGRLAGPSANSPSNPADTSKEQKEFLKQAVSGLAEDGKVICVRLALFAEMVKGKAWTPATLKEMGGTAGVGVTFLEETFSAATAPPEHRYHQKAARGVLKALLPESGSDIKGHMRSNAELLAASGYENLPGEFRRSDSHSRQRNPADHTDRPGRRGRRAEDEAEGARMKTRSHRPILTTRLHPVGPRSSALVPRPFATTSSRTTTSCTPCATGSRASSGRPAADGLSCDWRSGRPFGRRSQRTGICLPRGST